MRILIDTHILIWFLEGNSSLSKSRRQIIAASTNDVFVSIASLWEMAVKISIGKLTLAQPLADVIKQIDLENIEVSAILPEHILQVSTLPFHHRDPFDRIIIAQAQIEKLQVMSDDKEFSTTILIYFKFKVPQFARSTTKLKKSSKLSSTINQEFF